MLSDNLIFRVHYLNFIIFIIVFYLVFMFCHVTILVMYVVSFIIAFMWILFSLPRMKLCYHVPTVQQNEPSWFVVQLYQRVTRALQPHEQPCDTEPEKQPDFNILRGVNWCPWVTSAIGPSYKFTLADYRRRTIFALVEYFEIIKHFSLFLLKMYFSTYTKLFRGAYCCPTYLTCMRKI